MFYKKLTAYISLFLSLFSLVYSQNQSLGEPKWQTALAGDVVAQPQITSYGFISLTEGKILSACTGSGKVIWQKRIKDTPDPWYTITEDNFIYVVSAQGTKLSLYNPNGVFLWEAKLSSPATSNPIPGRDGRVFVPSEKSVSCFGINGICKWTIQVEKSKGFPLLTLPDGSLFFVQEKVVDKGSTVVRISPYGELLEEIRFTGIINAITQSDQGIILGFTDGVIGCCSIKDGNASTLWTIQHQNRFTKTLVKMLPSKNRLLCIYSDNTLILYDTQNIEFLWSIQTPYIDWSKSNSFAHYFDNYGGRYVFAHENGSFALNTEGTYIWNYSFNAIQKPTFVAITESNYLVHCNTNWIISGYLLYQTTEDITTTSYSTSNHPSAYSDFSVKNINENSDYTHIQIELISGNYGTKELIWKKKVERGLQLLQNDYFGIFKYGENIPEKIEAIHTSGLFGTTDFNHTLSLIFLNETEPSIINAALQAISNIGYDPKEELLQSVYRMQFSKKTILPDSTLSAICDTTYSICRFMGRPALYSLGKDMLMELLSDQYDKKIQQKSIETLQKILLLEM
jgi:hypothetical protein